MSTFCVDCISWKEAYKTGSDIMGICHNILVNSEIAIEHEGSEDGVLYTNSLFGCIHFRKANPVLIEFGAVEKQAAEKRMKEI